MILRFLFSLVLMFFIESIDAQDVLQYREPKTMSIADSSLYMDSVKFQTEKIKLNPKSSYQYCLRGYFYLNAFKIEDAVEDLQMAVKLDSNNARAYYYLGTSFLHLHKYALAIENLQKSVKLDSTLYAAFYNLGNAYMNSKLYEKAIPSYLIALEKYKVSSFLVKNIGRCYEMLNDNKKAKFYKTWALDSIIEQIKLDSLNSSLYSNRASINIYLNRYETVIDDYSKAIALYPTYSWYYKERGVALWSLSQTKESCADFLKAAQMGSETGLEHLCFYCKSLCKQYKKETKIKK